MATPEQQLQELRAALGTLTQQIGGIASRLDAAVSQGGTTADAVAQLRRETQNALVTGQQGGSDGNRPRRLQLVDRKDLKPLMLGLKDSLPIRAWAKRTMNILNIQCPNIRGVMQTAMLCKTPITSEEVAVGEWAEGADGNRAIFDYLLIATVGEAHGIVETCPDNGLEAWRLLIKRYDPRGGQHDLDRFNQLTRNITRARHTDELPGMLQAWTRDVEHFEARADVLRIDEATRRIVLLEMLPTKYAEEMRYKFNAG